MTNSSAQIFLFAYSSQFFTMALLWSYRISIKISIPADFCLEFCCVKEATFLFNSDQYLDETRLNCCSSWSFKGSNVLTTEHVVSTHRHNQGVTSLKLVKLELLTIFIVDDSAFRDYLTSRETILVSSKIYSGDLDVTTHRSTYLSSRSWASVICLW